MAKKNENDAGAIGCAIILLVGLVIAAVKAFFDFLGDNPFFAIIAFFCFAGAIGWWAYVRRQFERHLPAISILKLMSYPDSKIQHENRDIIDSYLHTIDYYNSSLKSVDQAIKEAKTKASSLAEYLDKIERSFDDDEKAILLDHARRIREADGTQNELASGWYERVSASIQNKHPEILLTSQNGPQGIPEELRPFYKAVRRIEESSLPGPPKALAGRFKDKVELILDMDFEPAIESRLEDILCVDFPDLVKEWQDIEELSHGRAKEEADSAFIAGFRRLCKSFEDLLEKQASFASGNVSTAAIYLRSKHLLEEDDPFHGSGQHSEDDILPERKKL